jgi:hypothetical protein
MLDVKAYKKEYVVIIFIIFCDQKISIPVRHESLVNEVQQR